MHSTYVLSFTHLNDQFDADRALHLLQRVASLVKPIMRKHGWVLPVLSEFYPENPSFHGLSTLFASTSSFDSDGGADENMGQKIFLRLRPAHSQDSLLSEEHVVQTMLHELTHNVYSDHDENFYKYLDDLQLEYKGLEWSGWDGEGFLSVGHRLGAGDFSAHVPPQASRLRALESAENRAKAARAAGSGGRLGGSAKKAGSVARELAAQAADKRLQDEKSCASGEEARREAHKAAVESITSKVIDMALDNGVSDPNAGATRDIQSQSDDGLASPSRKPQPKPRAVSKVLSSRLLRENLSTEKQVKSRHKSTNIATPMKKSSQTSSNVAREWSCSACTALNPANALQCDACRALRTVYSEREGWSCLLCGETGNIYEHWSCRFCGWIKLHS